MTNKEELDMYRAWFGFMYMCRNITHDIPAIEHAMSYIDKLGCSQTVGNGSADNDHLYLGVLEEMHAESWRDSSWNSGIDTEYKSKHKNHLAEELKLAKERLAEKGISV